MHNLAHMHADGSEEITARVASEITLTLPAANSASVGTTFRIQNTGVDNAIVRRAGSNHAAITNGEVRFLMGTWRERDGERRQFDRGCNLIGVDRRKGERRS